MGDQHWWGRQFRGASSDLWDPSRSYSSGQVQCQAVGHRQRKLQENTDGKLCNPGKFPKKLWEVMSCCGSVFQCTSKFTSGSHMNFFFFPPQRSTLRKRKMYEEFLSKVSILGENLARQLFFIILTDWTILVLNKCWHWPDLSRGVDVLTRVLPPEQSLWISGSVWRWLTPWRRCSLRMARKL